MHVIHDPASEPEETIAFSDFLKVDIRIGTVLSAEDLVGARKPSIKLVIDFGPGVGHKKSCAQVAALYDPASLVGRQVAAVVNFPPRQVGKAISEVLTLGFADAEGRVVLASPERPVPNGARLL
ncbi:tRNA-binding protein [Novosphingobium capsulatum]|uniref:tRNA-binding protein n=1 Tax=Novosphingobium capsulatum TaxID=13688 RepID=A0ABU1MHL7_9SPHN|nr:MULTISPECIES: tRNA-binding protein [Novosphingobium]KPF55595.1 tRNA-binding protein [Novosphingobium sp. AAP1]MBB3357679.1 tRNA-binding protein [Novosphingobium sp. BK256]MBB3373657.1 tRNA-binding protein [Novosphingobium sp. BK280]MBB3378069.1 tRNA-binding protein [Novosphingobium sp. BK258]MBB3420146.1 tRNA-binding protein [Novosphingobium sp. BK267]